MSTMNANEIEEELEAIKMAAFREKEVSSDGSYSLTTSCIFDVLFLFRQKLKSSSSSKKYER